MSQIIGALAVVICGLLYIAFGGLVFQLFWNHVIHGVFPTVALLTFWQGVVVAIVASFFIKR